MEVPFSLVRCLSVGWWVIVIVPIQKFTQRNRKHVANTAGGAKSADDGDQSAVGLVEATLCTVIRASRPGRGRTVYSDGGQ